MKTAEEFWSRVEVRGPHDCWLWCAAKTSGGYGSLNWRGRTTSSNRIALALATGPRPTQHALHHCDVRLCCNPLHLYWGTPLENNRDRVRRGRNNSHLRSGQLNGTHVHPESRGMGSRNGQAKLAEADVLAARRECGSSAEIASRLGISVSAAKKIRHGNTWRHVDWTKPAPLRVSLPGERNPSAKLTRDAVVAIREMRATGATLAAVAKAFTISPSQVRNVVAGVCWKDVQP